MATGQAVAGVSCPELQGRMPLIVASWSARAATSAPTLAVTKTAATTASAFPTRRSRVAAWPRPCSTSSATPRWPSRGKTTVAPRGMALASCAALSHRGLQREAVR